MQDVDLRNILEKNSECRSRDFQNILTNYQKLTGEIIRGSYYEVEQYKDKLRKLEINQDIILESLIYNTL